MNYIGIPENQDSGGRRAKEEGGQQLLAHLQKHKYNIYGTTV